jgi:hypothetical protein
MFDFENDLTLSDNKNRIFFIISNKRSNVYIYSNKKYFKIFPTFIHLLFYPTKILSQIKEFLLSGTTPLVI